MYSDSIPVQKGSSHVQSQLIEFDIYLQDRVGGANTTLKHYILHILHSSLKLHERHVGYVGYVGYSKEFEGYR